MAASKSPQLWLLHIRDEIDGVAAALHGVSFEKYRESYALRRVAERAVQIISEAAKALPSELLARYPDSPWNAIIGIGNVLRHEYQKIDDKRLWDILAVHLPQLRPVILRMLAELEQQAVSATAAGRYARPRKRSAMSRFLAASLSPPTTAKLERFPVD